MSIFRELLLTWRGESLLRKVSSDMCEVWPTVARVLATGEGVFGKHFRYPGRKRIEFRLIEAIAARSDAASRFSELCNAKDPKLIAYGLLGLEMISSPDIEKIGNSFFGREEEIFFREYPEGITTLGRFARLMVFGGRWPIDDGPQTP